MKLTPFALVRMGGDCADCIMAIACGTAPARFASSRLQRLARSGFGRYRVTAPARITQADVERATKAVAAAKLSGARIVLDLPKGRIEIIIGEPSAAPKLDEWSDDDV